MPTDKSKKHFIQNNPTLTLTLTQASNWSINKTKHYNIDQTSI